MAGMFLLGVPVLGGVVGGIAGDQDKEYSGSAGLELTAADHADAEVAAEAVRFAARLVDTPPEEMGPNALVAECKAVTERLASDSNVMEDGEVSFELIQGDDLDRRGYGGIFGGWWVAYRNPGQLRHPSPSPSPSL